MHHACHAPWCRRYCNCEKQLATSDEETDAASRVRKTSQFFDCASLLRLDPEAAKELAAELSQYGPGPGKELEQGSVTVFSACSSVWLQKKR